MNPATNPSESHNLKWLKIGLSQRTIQAAEAQGVVGPSDELHDELSQQWTTLLNARHLLTLPIPNLVPLQPWLSAVKLDGILLSGGNDHATRSTCETACIEYSMKHRLPLMGICHGFQCIARYFGATLIPIQGHVGCTHPVQIHENPYIPTGTQIVNSFHTLTIETLPDGFRPLATDLEGHFEAIYHETLPIVAFIWHPERPPFDAKWNAWAYSFYAKN